MKLKSLGIGISLVAALCSVPITGMAQHVTAAASANIATRAVPRLVNYSGVLKDAEGRPMTAITGVTFLIYKDEQGGAPIWLETQNVTPDKTGRYTVQLGAASANGIPAELFMTGEARWLAVQKTGEAEQARVLLVAVPYAMKAADAETVGGLPPSAFVLAAPPAAGGLAGASASSGAAESAPSSVPPPASTVTTSGGTVNTIPMFTTATNIQNSILTQTSTVAINVNGRLVLPPTGTATASAGFKSQPNNYIASAYNSGTAAAVMQKFLFQTEPVGNNTTTPSGTLNLLFGSGSAAATETGLKIASNGRITFASGQTFPIIAGAVTNAMLQHSSLTVTAGTDLTGGGSVALGGSTTLNLDTTKVPLLTGNNTFNGYDTFTGGYGWFQNGLYGEPFIEAYGAGNGTALWGFNNSTAAAIPTLYLENDDSTGAGDLVFDAVGPGFGGQCTIDVSGNLFCTGPLGTVAGTSGNRKVGLYTVQSSENWVEDFGSGRLSGGVATVQVEPRFGQAVTAANYHVFLTPAGDCKGLYVTNRTATSFEVHELNGGKSSVEFDYRIVAHRKGFEAVRLPDVTAKFAGKVARPAAAGTHQAKVVAQR
jgi:hypothetical protein